MRSNVHLALATSSHTRNFKLKTSHQEGFFSAFHPSRRILGDDERIPPGRGKPAPDIYFLALETINKDLRAKGEDEIMPEECLVFEDSVPGVEAGRRAGMRVIWCPHPEVLKLYKGREREVLAGIANEGDETAAETTGSMSFMDMPGKLDDGWGELLMTLQDFPFSKYGIEV